MRKFKNIFIAVVLAIATMIATISSANAGPQSFHGQAYDFTQYSTYNGAPLVNYHSYFLTNILSPGIGVWCEQARIGVEYKGGNCWGSSSYKALYSGQPMRVLCWTTDVQNGYSIVDKIAFGYYYPSNVFNMGIGYVTDAGVNLSYSDRATYVPHC
jgi:hypothetical protein